MDTSTVVVVEGGEGEWEDCGYFVWGFDEGCEGE